METRTCPTCKESVPLKAVRFFTYHWEHDDCIGTGKAAAVFVTKDGTGSETSETKAAKLNPFWFFDGSPVVEPATAKTAPPIDPWHAVRD